MLRQSFRSNHNTSAGAKSPLAALLDYKNDFSNNYGTFHTQNKETEVGENLLEINLVSGINYYGFTNGSC